MSKRKDELLTQAIKDARKLEKEAIAEARQRASEWVREQTREQHEVVLEAVREALLGGYSSRQIGLAYGSTDPYTAKRLVSEANATSGRNFAQAMENHPDWLVENLPDGTFRIKAFALGEQKLSGEGIFEIDEDGQNLTQISGDSFIQVQVYRLGLVPQILEEVNV